MWTTRHTSEHSPIADKVRKVTLDASSPEWGHIVARLADDIHSVNPATVTVVRCENKRLFIPYDVEREKIKKRALEKEMKWIEKMAMKQQDRNKANRRLEEMEEAAVVIQGSFRTHKARKVTNALKEEKARRDLEKATLPPTLEDDSHRLFDDD